MLQSHRLVEVFGSLNGSGYLVGPGLILTAGHVVRAAQGGNGARKVEVRILGQLKLDGEAGRLRRLPATLLWPDAPDSGHLDFALLQVDGYSDTLDDAFVPWAGLVPGDELEVRTAGFPDSAIYENPASRPGEPSAERDTVAVSGRVQTASGYKQQLYGRGQLDIVLRPEDLPGGSLYGWQGMSGAAVFAGPLLVGVIVRADDHDGKLQRLVALPVERLFCLPAVRERLLAAGLELPPPVAPLAPFFASDLLDRFGVAAAAPSEFRAGAESFLTSYLGTTTRPVVFGGREPMLERLSRWLDDPDAPPHLLLHAPGGRGKSALLVQWLLTAGERCLPIFLPISARAATNRPRLFYEALAARLAAILGCELGAPSAMDPVDHYRGLATDWLRRLDARGKPVLLVIDGLDEAAGWELPPTLLPLSSAALRIVVSARARAGDRGAEGWLRQLGWDRREGCFEVIEVEPLDVDGVAGVLRGAQCLPAGAAGAEVAREVLRLSGGDGFMVQLYAEELGRAGGAAGDLTPASLARRAPGFGPFFHDWLRDQKAIWQARAQPIDAASLDVVLAILACAFGPLHHEHLAEIYRCCGGPEVALARDAIEPINRFVQGDGVASGYVLAHAKFADFLREEYFADPLLPRRAREAIQHWGLRTLAALDAGTLAPARCPGYLVTYLGQHLVAARAPVEDFMRLVGAGWRGAWHSAEGGYRGFALDVRRAAHAVEQRAAHDARRWAWRLRCALVIGSIGSAGTQVPGWLIAACVAAGKLTGRQALYLLEQRGLLTAPGYVFDLPALESRAADAEALVALARVWPPGADRQAGVGEVLLAVGRIGAEHLRADALVAIAPLLPEALLGEALRIAMSIGDDERRAAALAALLPAAPVALRAETMQAVLLDAAAVFTRSLQVLLPSVPAARRDAVLAHLDIDCAGDASRRACAMVAVATCLPGQAERALAACADVADDKLGARLFRVLTPHLPDASLAEALRVALAIGGVAERWSAVAALMPRLDQRLLADAARAARDWAPYQRALALGAIASRMTDEHERAAVHAWAERAIEAIDDDRTVLLLLPSLLPLAPDEGARTALLARLLSLVESAGEERMVAFELERAAPYLPVPLFARALRIVAGIADRTALSMAFLRLAEHLPDALAPQAFAIACGMQRELSRCEAIAAVASKLPDALLRDALATIVPLAGIGGGPALVALIPRLPQDLLGHAQQMAFHVLDEPVRRQAMALLVLRLPLNTLERTLAWAVDDLNGKSLTAPVADFIWQLPDALLPAALLALRTIKYEFARVEALLAILPRLPDALLGEALRLTREFGQDDALASGLAAIAPRLPPGPAREQALAAALEAVARMSRTYEQANVLRALLPALPAALLGAALDLIKRVADDGKKADILDDIAAGLPQDLLPRAWDLARDIASPRPRARALAAVANGFAADKGRAEALELALRTFMTIDDEGARVTALAALIPHLPHAEQLEASGLALRLANAIVERKDKVRALGRLAAGHDAALKSLLGLGAARDWDDVAEALVEHEPMVVPARLAAAVAAIGDERERREALLALIKRLPESARGGFLALGLGLRDEYHLSAFVGAAAPYFGPDHINAARRATARIRSKFSRRSAREALAPHVRPSWVARMRQRFGTARHAPAEQADETLRRAATLNEYHRAQALIRLAPSLPDQLAPEALRLCAGIWHDFLRARVLEGMMPFLSEPRKAEALTIAAGIEIAHAQAGAIAGMVPHLSAPLLDQVLTILASMDDERQQVVVLVALAPHLEGPRLQQVIASTSARLSGARCRAEALAVLGARLPSGSQRAELLAEALRIAHAIDEDGRRVAALRLLLPLLPADLQETAVCALLAAAGREPRATLLETVPILIGAVDGFRSQSNVLDAYHAVRDVGEWFP